MEVRQSPARNVVDLVEGVPFVDLQFSAKLLCGAVAAKRRLIASELGNTDDSNVPFSVAEVLSPEYGRSLRSHEGFDAVIPNRALSDTNMHKVRRAIAFIADQMPAWRVLFSLPVNARLLDRNDAISCSCYAFPQHIFLAESAFASHAELCEQVIHELAHNWLYLVEEIESFYPTRGLPKYQLPSGTADRDLGEVIGAAHVSASLVRWYGRTHVDMRSSSRLEEVTDYFHGCLDVLDQIPQSHFTSTSTAVVTRLRCFAETLTAQ